MFTESAELDDLIYSTFKDYVAETAALAALIRREHPRASINTAESNDLHLARMAHTHVEGRLSRIRFEYLVGRPSWIEHATEVYELGLFTTAEMLDAFREAGLEATHDPLGVDGRGLFLGRQTRT